MKGAKNNIQIAAGLSQLLNNVSMAGICLGVHFICSLLSEIFRTFIVHFFAKNYMFSLIVNMKGAYKYEQVIVKNVDTDENNLKQGIKLAVRNRNQQHPLKVRSSNIPANNDTSKKEKTITSYFEVISKGRDCTRSTSNNIAPKRTERFIVHCDGDEQDENVYINLPASTDECIMRTKRNDAINSKTKTGTSEKEISQSETFLSESRDIKYKIYSKYTIWGLPSSSAVKSAVEDAETKSANSSSNLDVPAKKLCISIPRITRPQFPSYTRLMIGKTDELYAGYHEDILKYVLHREREMVRMTKRDYMRLQPALKESERRELITWVMDVMRATNTPSFLFFLTVSIIDRALTAIEIEIGKVYQLQLIGCAALLIASKMDDRNWHSLSEIQKFAAGKFSKINIRKMERILLRVLNYDINYPGIDVFTHFYLLYDKDAQDPKVTSILWYLLELSTFDSSFFTYLPSRVAAASFVLAKYLITLDVYECSKMFDIEEYNKTCTDEKDRIVYYDQPGLILGNVENEDLDENCWSVNMEENIGIYRAEFHEIIHKLATMHLSLRRAKRKPAVYLKYAEATFNSVSTTIHIPERLPFDPPHRWDIIYDIPENAAVSPAIEKRAKGKPKLVSIKSPSTKSACGHNVLPVNTNMGNKEVKQNSSNEHLSSSTIGDHHIRNAEELL